MSNQKDGGTAFPASNYTAAMLLADGKSPHGMTLRDWFAGKALASCIEHHTLECRTKSKMPDYDDGAHREAVARMAFNFADAMIRELEKRNAST